MIDKDVTSIIGFKLCFFPDEKDPDYVVLGIEHTETSSKDLYELLKDHPDWGRINGAINAARRICKEAEAAVRDEINSSY